MSKQSRDFVNGFIVGSNLGKQGSRKQSDTPSASSLLGWMLGCIIGLGAFVLIVNLIR